MIFPLRSSERKNKYDFFFPSYLPNQKIQGRGTANKQFFKDGLNDSRKTANKYLSVTGTAMSITEQVGIQQGIFFSFSYYAGL